jgi:2,4-dienoyl-CoA reductase-like NADH-dependent reductase (Old Yellow Enzyme family)
MTSYPTSARETARDISSPLFRPFDSGTLHLSNRLVMAPMTRSHSPHGVPGPAVVEYYRRRAEGGTALIITEGTWIPHPTASNEENVPKLHGEAALAGWKLVVDAVHAAGGLIFPQIWHVGLTAKPQLDMVFGEEDFATEPVMGPSGIRLPGGEIEAEPMTQEDINAVVTAYGEAAANAVACGFDGVEIHGAHGYLIDQFFWEATNRRTDGYGGSAANRARFATEVVTECRRRVGPDFPISFRFSQWKTIDFAAKNARTPDELSQMVQPLADAGVDIFHCSTRRYWEPEFEMSGLNLAGWVKKLTGKPTITVGSVGLGSELLESLSNTDVVKAQDIDVLMDMLRRDEFDLVAVGRALIADPQWPLKVREGRSDFRAFSSPILATLE